ncbi:hypothetical protein ISN45_Aa02g008120 [Arabidopsis thaliana x Arabidopsis arenosa]|uniref:Uncharacterized protein n=1 Tax=Arabidopsis thaliana x Arabidopsis arenosa TaxID=1240361 RepID=A0A8T2BDW2_9BRAS|nr:hypothetical protein ISN45_Aa02g008120 [Arabidopsis thaliana x Arabidopsis arenosa]
MSFIPNPLITDIIRRIGSQGFRYLGPFIAAGPWFKEIVYSREVLLDVDLDEFMFNTRLGREESIYRPFLLRCAAEGHKTARYIESLRRLTQVGPSVEALEMLGEVAYSDLYTLFAFAVMLLCCVSYEQGMIVNRTFMARFETLQDAIDIADVVESQIRFIGPGGRRVFSGYIHYLEYPICYFDHNTDLTVCQHCLVFNYANRFHDMC